MTRHLRSVPPVVPSPPTVVVAWTAQAFCGVCDRTGRVAFHWMDGRIRGRGVMACPHSTDPRSAIPVLPLPFRTDIPKDVA